MGIAVAIGAIWLFVEKRKMKQFAKINKKILFRNKVYKIFIEKEIFMKKKLFIPLLCLGLILMTACGKNNTIFDKTSNIQDSSQMEESLESRNAEESKDNTDDEAKKQSGFEELNEVVSTDVDNTISDIKSKYEKLVTEIDTYEKYLENTDKIEAFYKQVYNDIQNLCIRMREYSINYAEAIMASTKSNVDKYKDFAELYDCIYDDAGDDIYDEIYDGILDDIYDDFYDGILDDAYDNGAPYDEWSDARSNEYDWWSNARSDVYDEWSDFRSSVYDFWSDMRSELWDDDVERAVEKIVDFQEDIEKLKNKGTQSNVQTSNEENDNSTTLKEAETKDDGVKSRTVSGFDEETNQTIVFHGIEFSFPSYFDVCHEDSTENDMTYYPEEKDYYCSLRFSATENLEFSAEDFDVKKSLMALELAKQIQEIYGEDSREIKSEAIAIAGLPGWTLSCIAADGDDPSTTNCSFVYLSDAHKMITVLLDYTYYDESNYDYSGDYEKIIQSATLVDAGKSDAGETPSQKEKPEESTKSSDGIDPGFKAMMDSYEEFFNSYVEFMKKYNKSNNSMEMLMEYADFMKKYTETMKKLENIKAEELSTEEYKYYMDVYNRITKKLLEVYD